MPQENLVERQGTIESITALMDLASPDPKKLNFDARLKAVNCSLQVPRFGFGMFRFSIPLSSLWPGPVYHLGFSWGEIVFIDTTLHYYI